MKIGTALLPQPTITRDPKTGNLQEDYLPDCLERGIVHRISHIRKSMWGTIIKTDRLEEWINLNWFRPV